MIKKWFYKLRWFLPSIINKCTFKIRRIDVGTNVKVLGRMFIRGKGKIKIGNDVTINSCLEANPIGGVHKQYSSLKMELNLE